MAKKRIYVEKITQDLYNAYLELDKDNPHKLLSIGHTAEEAVSKFKEHYPDQFKGIDETEVVEV